MVFPTKKDIEDAINSLNIHVDACAEYFVPMTAKRIGGLIAMSKSSRYISEDEEKYYHDQSNKLISKFKDLCSCKHK